MYILHGLSFPGDGKILTKSLKIHLKLDFYQTMENWKA